MKKLIKAFRLLEPAERHRLVWVLLLVVIMALFETLGTVSVMPFLAVLANPDLIRTSHVLSWFYLVLGFTKGQDFLFFLGLCSFGLLVVSATIRMIGGYVVNRFSQTTGFAIGERLMETYLRQPYSYHLIHNTSDMNKELLSEVMVLISQVYSPAMQLISQGVLLAVMIPVLIAVNPGVALAGIGIVGVAYGVIYVAARRYIDWIGRQRSLAVQERLRALSEGLGGIKAVKLHGREAYYVERYANASMRNARYQAAAITLSALPRFVVEAIAFGGVILLTLSLMVQYQDSANGALSKILPLLGLYVFAGYRILPVFQGIYNSLSMIRFGSAALESVSAGLEDRDSLAELPRVRFPPLPFNEAVEFRNIGFRHESAVEPSLIDINLRIPKGSTVGIVGSTGAGKTTLVDVLLGLLTPEKGEIVVDGTPVTPQNLRSWQADIGYVPQDIFLLDASVAQNIAFGVASEEINVAKIRECARLAQILDFVEHQLPQGFDTLVGERGVRLSGGQRQRIGIARALYNDPGILVFDEATSALDNLTEKEVVREINALTGTRTILIVAHRISTVMNCDQILVLDRGRAVGLGPYQDLYETNAAFRQLVDARKVA